MRLRQCFFFCKFWLNFKNTPYIERFGLCIWCMWCGLQISQHPPEGHLKKTRFWKYFGKTHTWTLVPEYLFNKVAGLQPTTLLKRDFHTGVFPLILCILRQIFYRTMLKRNLHDHLRRSYFKNLIPNNVPFLCVQT